MDATLRVHTHFEPPLGHRPCETEQKGLIFGGMRECRQGIPQVEGRFDGSSIMGTTECRRDILLRTYPLLPTLSISRTGGVASRQVCKCAVV